MWTGGYAFDVCNRQRLGDEEEEKAQKRVGEKSRSVIFAQRLGRCKRRPFSTYRRSKESLKLFHRNTGNENLLSIGNILII